MVGSQSTSINEEQHRVLTQLEDFVAAYLTSEGEPFHLFYYQGIQRLIRRGIDLDLPITIFGEVINAA